MADLFEGQQSSHFTPEQLKAPGKLIQESMNWFGGFTPWMTSLLGPDQDGTLWQMNGGSAGPYPPQTNVLLYIINSQYYNRLQRWMARYILTLNSYAIAAVESVATLAIGNEYKIIAETDAEQRRIDEWWDNQGNENYPDYCGRAYESLKNYMIDGEVFLRIFGIGGPAEKTRVRFVDPDLVVGSNDYDMGIVLDPEDYETVEGYNICGVAANSRDYPIRPDSGIAEVVPAKDVQHRKNAGSGQRRGFSYILPIYQNLLDADSLLHNIVVKAETAAKFVAKRTWESDAGAVATVRSQIQSQVQPFQAPYVPGGTPDMLPAGTASGQGQPNQESYPTGTILDLPKGADFSLLETKIEGEDYVAVLRAILRQVATRFGLPEAILSQDQDSMAAYTAALVSNSYLVKSMERWQTMVWNWDRMLLKKCGFNVKKLHPQFGEVVIADQKHQANLMELLHSKKLASNQTIAKMIDIDYEAEVEVIKREQAEIKANEVLQPELENVGRDVTDKALQKDNVEDIASEK